MTPLTNRLYGLLVYGKEKAVTAAVVSFILSLCAQIGISGDMTVREALTSLGIALLNHASVYYKSNRY